MLNVIQSAVDALKLVPEQFRGLVFSEVVGRKRRRRRRKGGRKPGPRPAVKRAQAQKARPVKAKATKAKASDRAPVKVARAAAPMASAKSEKARRLLDAVEA